MPFPLETVVALMFASAFDYWVYSKMQSPARYLMIVLIFANVLYALLGMSLYNPPPYLMTTIIYAHVLIFGFGVTLEALFRAFDVSKRLALRKRRALMRKYSY